MVDPSRFLLGAAAAFDRAATYAAYARARRSRRSSRAESLDHAARLDALERLEALYSRPIEGWFRPPRSIEPSPQPVRRLAGSVVEDLRWDSAFDPLTPGVAERYLRGEDNRRAAARLWRHERVAGRATERPAIVLIHGYLGGHHGMEERIWPIRWLHHRLGLDVALFVLPFHGLRAVRGRRGAPPFPGADPRVTNEGFRQAMGDLRDLIHWLKSRGNRQVGVMGMSLGGYTTSLVATVEPELAFAVPVIPLASMADFARDQGRLGRTPEEAAREHAALERVYAPVSPLHRRLVIDPERVLIVAAEADRITPIHHAERLAEHFEAPLETFVGGHLLQFGRAEAFRRVGRLLGELGVISR